MREYVVISMRANMPKHIPQGTAELSVYIDKQLKMDFKLACVAQNKSMSEIIEQLVHEWLESQAKQSLKNTKDEGTV